MFPSFDFEFTRHPKRNLGIWRMESRVNTSCRHPAHRKDEFIFTQRSCMNTKNSDTPAPARCAASAHNIALCKSFCVFVVWNSRVTSGSAISCLSTRNKPRSEQELIVVGTKVKHPIITRKDFVFEKSFKMSAPDTATRHEQASVLPESARKAGGPRRQVGEFDFDFDYEIEFQFQCEFDFDFDYEFVFLFHCEFDFDFDYEFEFRFHCVGAATGHGSASCIRKRRRNWNIVMALGGRRNRFTVQLFRFPRVHLDKRLFSQNYECQRAQWKGGSQYLQHRPSVTTCGNPAGSIRSAQSWTVTDIRPILGSPGQVTSNANTGVRGTYRLNSIKEASRSCHMNDHGSLWDIQRIILRRDFFYFFDPGMQMSSIKFHLPELPNRMSSESLQMYRPNCIVALERLRASTACRTLMKLLTVTVQYELHMDECAYGCNPRNRYKIRVSGMGRLLVPDPTEPNVIIFPDSNTSLLGCRKMNVRQLDTIIEALINETLPKQALRKFGG
ncbi:unnamed protein product [Nesidiocoris tenuis]|uniref:Uncharacterized protein n=1 Tax=Nesidiocoris tenuis TaxID=355587 RepID=A0A6H5G206_9HEMI|nr:unnamed protein product [Nesidiocoris tenuis]